jgi:hypothetical protein
MAIRTLAGYPQYVCEKYELVIDLDGPTSYNNTGTFGTSGQQINVSDLGMGGIEYAESDGLSSDGVNAVQLVLGATTAGATNLQPAPAVSPGPLATTMVIHWYTTASSGTEVANTTNLSTKYVRIRIRCV